MIKELWTWIKTAFESEYIIKRDTHIKHKDLKKNLERMFKQCYIEITDDRKYTIPLKDMEKFLNLNLYSLLKYRVERRDCEDYASVLNGLFRSINGQHAFGFVFVYSPRGKHALNCFIDDFEQFWYIEPQTNEIISSKYSDYTPYLIVI